MIQPPQEPSQDGQPPQTLLLCQGLASGAPWPHYNAMEALKHDPSHISVGFLGSSNQGGINFFSENRYEVGNNYHN
ncbi:hypothetical protein V6N13_087365 [Hibiscus sabdariffa]